MRMPSYHIRFDIVTYDLPVAHLVVGEGAMKKGCCSSLRMREIFAGVLYILGEGAMRKQKV
jgi:hypothetical protein